MTFYNKTVFIATHQGFAARYLLRTDIFRVLKASGARIVIVTPNPDEAYFREEFEDTNVYIEKFEYAKNDAYTLRSRLQRFLEAVRLLVLSDKGDLEAIRRREVRERAKLQSWRGKLQWLLARPLVLLLRRSLLLRRLLIGFESRFLVPDSHQDIFLKYRLDLMIVSSLGYWRHDAYMIREAHMYGAKVLSVILSWDNTSSKGMAGASPDYVVAWTENMKKELVEYHDIEPNRIFTGGVAHFDTHFAKQPQVSRAELFEQMGLTQDRRLILFGTGSPSVWSDLNVAIIRTIGKAIQEDRFVEPCQLLVRVHPIYLARVLKRVEESRINELCCLGREFPFVFFDVPDTNSQSVTFDLPMADLHRLRAMLENADVLVNIYSTLMLEASIFNLPIINAAFDTFNEKLQDVNSCVERYPHLRRILSVGGTRTAHNEEELIEHINAYLTDPTLDAIGRSLIKVSECGPNQGRAGAIIAEHILSLL